MTANFTTTAEADAHLDRLETISMSHQMLLDGMNVTALVEEFNSNSYPLDNYVTITAARNTYYSQKIAQELQRTRLPEITAGTEFEQVSAQMVGLFLYPSLISSGLTITATRPNDPLSQSLTRLYRLFFSGANVAMDTKRTRDQYGILLKMDPSACDGLLVHARTSRREVIGYFEQSRRSANRFRIIPETLLSPTWRFDFGMTKNIPAINLLEFPYARRFPDLDTPSPATFEWRVTDVSILGSRKTSAAAKQTSTEIIAHFHKAKAEFEALTKDAWEAVDADPEAWKAVSRVRNIEEVVRTNLFGDPSTLPYAKQLSSTWSDLPQVLRDHVDEEQFMKDYIARLHSTNLSTFDPDVIATMLALDPTYINDSAALDYWKKYIASHNVPPIRL
jgi:hypothetical protein